MANNLIDFVNLCTDLAVMRFSSFGPNLQYGLCSLEMLKTLKFGVYLIMWQRFEEIIRYVLLKIMISCILVELRS